MTIPMPAPDPAPSPDPAPGLVGGLRAHLHLLHTAKLRRRPDSVGWFAVGPVKTATDQLCGVSLMGPRRGVAVFLCPARQPHE
jgi:hypothetical protein